MSEEFTGVCGGVEMKSWSNGKFRVNARPDGPLKLLGYCNVRPNVRKDGWL